MDNSNPLNEVNIKQYIAFEEFRFRFIKYICRIHDFYFESARTNFWQREPISILLKYRTGDRAKAYMVRVGTHETKVYISVYPYNNEIYYCDFELFNDPKTIIQIIKDDYNNFTA